MGHIQRIDRDRQTKRIYSRGVWKSEADMKTEKTMAIGNGGRFEKDRSQKLETSGINKNEWRRIVVKTKVTQGCDASEEED